MISDDSRQEGQDQQPGTQSFQSRSEELVFHLCRRSFLSLWSYANPRGHRDKEMCDVLVVCDPHVVIISVKEAKWNDAVAPELAKQRWLKSAVTKSVGQLNGAARWLQRAGNRVIRHDGSEGLPFPDEASRRVHLISVSLGGGRRVPLPSSHHGRGFIHVLDEDGLLLVMQALDTVTDFVDYLMAKEDLARVTPELLIHGEEDLMAIYLHKGRRFPEPLPKNEVPPGLWDLFVTKPEFQAKVEEDRVSYAWDQLVEHFCGHALAGTLEFGNELTEAEWVFREMAREPRFGRRLLALAFLEFVDKALKGLTKARMTASFRGTGYVFLNARPDRTRESRRTELEMRAFIARGDLQVEKVIGICVNVQPAPEGYCEEVLMLHMPEWTEGHAREAERLKAELGFFATPEISNRHYDEYPGT